jgi:hypothetical protein
MSSTIRRGTSSKLSQNSSIIAAIMRFSALGPGRFSSREMVGWEQSSAPPSGRRPTAILNAGSVRSASQSLPSSHGSGCAGPRTGSAGRDQERAAADHLGERVPDPLRRPRILEAARQALGNVEASLDLGEHQNPAVRGQPAGVEAELHRLAGDR